MFTDSNAKKIEIKELAGGESALRYRKTLEKKLKKVVIAWLCIGGDNPQYIGK